MKKILYSITACLTATALIGTPVPAKAATGLLTDTPQRTSVHDPSIAVSEDGKTYYIFGSHIEAAKTTDLINWEKFSNGYHTPENVLFGDLSKNLSVPFKWAGENDSDSKGGFSVWAPDVFYNKDYVNEDGSKGAYMMYFCTSSTAIRSAIAFGVSQNIEGPYTYADTLLYSGFTKESAKDFNSNVDKKYTNTNIQTLIDNGTLDGISDNWFTSSGSFNNADCPNAIDPTIFEDKDGRLWMTYGSWSGGIFLLEIDPATGKAKYPGKDGIAESGLRVDKYFGTQIAGGNKQSGEGPYILYDKDSDYYYMYVTYEWLGRDGGYNMRLFRSKNPDGPYVDADGTNAALDDTNKTNHSHVGIKVMGNYTLSTLDTAGYKSPGHCSAFIDNDNQRYLIYHTRFEDKGELHEVRVHQQFLNEEGWPVTAVFENQGEQISETGYAKEDIIGNYEFINHGTRNDKGDLIETETISLNADGTISGDEKGTWTAKEGTYYMSLNIDDVTYSGVFFKQHDEETNRQETMTFTAIGSNDQTLWGVRDQTFKLNIKKDSLFVGGNKDKTTNAFVSCAVDKGEYTVSYSSDDETVAKIDEKTGKITALDFGYVTINAAVKHGDKIYNLSKSVDIDIASIKFTSKKNTLKPKKTATFKVKTKGITAGSVKWKSSNTSVLKVNKKGKVTAKKAGTAKITAYYGKTKATVKVTVKK